MHSQPIDFTALATAFDAKGFNIRTPEDFRRLPEDLAHSKIPTVLDIAIDPASKLSGEWVRCTNPGLFDAVNAFSVT
ncbi:MAG: hypothetical protein ACREYC_03905 [Gammaproteobacteria bacterium]